MVSLDEMIRSALAYDTAMSRAMLRACGVPVPRRLAVGSIARVDAFEGMAECMANRESPMDGRSG